MTDIYTLIAIVAGLATCDIGKYLLKNFKRRWGENYKWWWAK